MAGFRSEVFARLAKSYSGEFLRAEPEKVYSTLEDFRRAAPSLRRVLVVGATGTGKSSLLNILGGWRLVQRPPAYTLEWEREDGKAPLFKAEVSARSVTDKLQISHLKWFGDESRPFTAVDTPGSDDSESADITDQQARERLQALAADLHNKLKALGHVHVILVLHNDVRSNRLSPSVYEVLKMLDERFANGRQNVWDHVVVAYTKCNECETIWRSELDKKKQQQREEIKEKIPGCNIDLPILCLGGAEVIDESNERMGRARTSLGGEERMARRRSSAGSSAGGEERMGRRRSSVGSRRSPSRSRSRSRSRSPREERPVARTSTSSGISDFERLWQIINTKPALDSARLNPFEGSAGRWERMLRERDRAEARVRASMIYASIMMRFLMLSVLMFFRAFLAPGWLLDLPGPVDEFVILAFLVYWIGPGDVWHSSMHFLEVWLEPYAGRWFSRAHRD